MTVLIKSTFLCSQCGETKQANGNGFTTGYGVNDVGQPICYACCAKQDRQWMLDNGRITLYLTQIDNPKYPGPFKRGQRIVTSSDWRIVNWPNSLQFNVTHIRLGDHNIARTRLDVWFIGPDGYEWHGVQYGEHSQLCHCKRTKTIPHYVTSVALLRGLVA